MHDNQRQENMQVAMWVIGAVVLIVLLLVGAKFFVKPSQNNPTTSTTASPDLVNKVATVSADTFTTVNTGTAQSLPKPIQAPALTKDGKPLILYVGAEYCPFCATERWPVVAALSRFGSFSNLGITSSSSSDVYPNTATFSFHGASYTSQYISFSGRETETNERQGNGYAPLDTLSSDEQAVLSTYDASPYVPAQSAGAIPFIDFGGRFLISGSSYSPTVLQGKTAEQIADALKDTNDPITQGVIGSANTLTAAICVLTNDQPANVCSSPVIQALESNLKK